MSYTMTGAITGSTVTGLTSPTYTLTADSAAQDGTRRSFVTTLGGTQTGVTAHAVSSPFSVTVTRPNQSRVLGKPNLNGLITNVGRNTYKLVFVKGATPLVNQPVQNAYFRGSFEIPAGTESYDVINLKALASIVGGFMNTNASGIADVFANGLL